MTLALHLGDCLEVMRTMPDASVDAVVCDPPYGLAFMGKRWDYDVPTTEVWAECLRVLKPGGHLLAFAGTRTQHRMAVRIEDAGFEIRDMIAWVYGSGFPKSLDVSKAIDKAAGAEREVVGLFPSARSSCGGGVDRNAHDTCVYSGGWGLHDSSAGQYYDTGSAARFFYTAKCSKSDREGSDHPTMKPTDLMRYLCRLVTPPGGVVLDPFMGSGSTGKAAMLEGFGFIGIEREAAYHAIAECRIRQAGAAGHQPDLFAGVAA